jgi:hypothetical protein
MSMMLEFDVTAANPRTGRTVKFTPERMEQIRNLVERGHSREQIADVIGCTLGSLQVTCSRFGISLRRPPRDTSMVKKRAVDTNNVDGPNDNGPDGNGKRALEPADFLPPAKKDSPATFVLRATYGERTYDMPLQLSPGTVGLLAIAAEVRGLRLGQFVAEILTECVQAKLEP